MGLTILIIGLKCGGGSGGWTDMEQCSKLGG